jgi:hypothetical protein
MSHSLESKVALYIEVARSEEYQKAKKLVNDHKTAQAYIKSEFKKNNRTRMTTHNGTLEFRIRQDNRLDTQAMSEELKEQYRKLIDVWVESIYENNNVQ